jgi:hypothetical protein
VRARRSVSDCRAESVRSSAPSSSSTTSSFSSSTGTAWKVQIRSATLPSGLGRLYLWAGTRSGRPVSRARLKDSSRGCCGLPGKTSNSRRPTVASSVVAVLSSQARFAETTARSGVSRRSGAGATKNACA